MTGLRLEATFDFEGASFEYVEPREAPPDVADAARKYVCLLRVDFASGDAASFLELLPKDDVDLT